MTSGKVVEAGAAGQASTTRDPRERFSWPQAQYVISDVAQIIDPAAELFAEKGFANSSMDELAARIGVAKRTLYAYVGTKVSVLEAIFDHYVRLGEEIMQEAAAQATAPERLRSVLRNWIRVSVTMPGYAEVFFNQRTALPAAARETVHEAASKMMRQLRGFVIEGQASGEFTGTLDPTLVTFSIMAMTTQTGNWLNPDAGLTWEEAAEQAYRLVAPGLLTGGR